MGASCCKSLETFDCLEDDFSRERVKEMELPLVFLTEDDDRSKGLTSG